MPSGGRIRPSKPTAPCASNPSAAHEATLHLPLEELGIPSGEPCELHELLSDGRSLVRGGVLTVALNPAEEPAAIYRVEYPADRPREGGW